MNILIIANPASGGYNPRIIETVKKILETKSKSVSVVLTERAGHASDLAATAKQDLVIAAGGDGLINEVAQGLIKSKKFLSVLPFGTANVFCCEYGINLDPIKAAQNLNLKNRTQLTVGYLDERLFLLMAGFGFDAETVKNIHFSKKKIKFKKLAHIISGCKVLLKKNFKLLDVFLAGHKISAYHFIISIASCYGGKHNIGKIQRGRLNIFSVTSPKLFSVIKMLFSIFIGKGIHKDPIVANCLKLSGASCCQLDGEFVPIDKSSVFLRIKRNALILIH